MLQGVTSTACQWDPTHACNQMSCGLLSKAIFLRTLAVTFVLPPTIVQTLKVSRLERRVFSR